MSMMPVRLFPSLPATRTAAAEPGAQAPTQPPKMEKDRPLWWLPGTVYLFPLGYVAGRVYRESYIGQLGLLESDLTLAADEYVYRGFLALVSLADHLASRVSPELATGWYLSFLSLGVLVTPVIFATSRFSLAISRRAGRLKARTESFRKNSSPDFKASLSVVVGTWITAVAPVLALFTLALLVLLVLPAGVPCWLDRQVGRASCSAVGPRHRRRNAIPLGRGKPNHRRSATRTRDRVPTVGLCGVYGQALRCRSARSNSKNRRRG